MHEPQFSASQGLTDGTSVSTGKCSLQWVVPTPRRPAVSSVLVSAYTWLSVFRSEERSAKAAFSMMRDGGPWFDLWVWCLEGVGGPGTWHKCGCIHCQSISSDLDGAGGGIMPGVGKRRPDCRLQCPALESDGWRRRRMLKLESSSVRHLRDRYVVVMCPASLIPWLFWPRWWCLALVYIVNHSSVDHVLSDMSWFSLVRESDS